MQNRNERKSKRFAAGGAFIQRFWPDERGQDITEYTLLLSFVVLASAAVLTIDASSMGGIWGDARQILSAANQQAAGS